VRAIDSVLRQTNSAWRLVVCDDSPVDEGIGELVGGYGDRRMRYCRNPVNLGLAGNWNKCLNEAETDLVTILHADDELLPGYCDLMLAAVQEFPLAAGWYCQAIIIDQRGKKTFTMADLAKRLVRPAGASALELNGPSGVAALLRGNFIVCPTMCYRRSRLGERRFDPQWRFVLDLEFFARLLLDGETLVGVPVKAYAYRRHGGSETSRQTRSLHRFAEEISLYDRLSRVDDELKNAELAAVGTKKRMIKLNLWYCLLRDLSKMRWTDARAKLAILLDLRNRKNSSSRFVPASPGIKEPVGK